MTKVKVEDLSDDEIDALVARIEKLESPEGFHPTRDCSQAWPIIERENIGLQPHCQWKFGCPWYGHVRHETRFSPGEYGRTGLEAAMRAWVAFNLGDEVESPFSAEAPL